MRKLIVLFAAIGFCGAAVAGSPVPHRVVSCNIRVALPQDELPGNGWSTRKAICEKVMKRQKADIYCLQEVFGEQIRDLRTLFPDYFAFGYEGPEMDTMPDSVYFGITKNVVLFSKKRYKLQGGGTYWLSETPLIGGSKSWETARARHVSWVRLKDLKTGKVFRVASIHLDHIAQQARERQIEVTINEASQYPVDFPQLLVGDFNSTPSNPVAVKLTEAGWVDAFEQANGSHAPELSCHAFQGEARKSKGVPGHIDFIYMKGAGVKALSSELIKDAIEGKFPSDHYFLSADIVIE